MMLAESDILYANLLIVDDQEVNVSLLEQLLRDHRPTWPQAARAVCANVT